jgi:two-component system sensor histidine kinase KdpD
MARAAVRPHNRFMRWRNFVAAAATVAASVATLRLLKVESAGIAAPLLLLDVVVVARFWGTAAALVAAAAGAASYSYYFLPPLGFAIRDPGEWFDFLTFIVTAVVAGELASRAERRAAEAQAGRQEIERLYRELQVAFDRASEAEAARRNEQLKSALLDALTHNLRTPLTAIKASVTALIGAGTSSGFSQLSAEGQRELLEIIDEESDRLNRFIEALSNAGQPDASQPPHLRVASLNDIVRSSLARADTITRDHVIREAIDDHLPPLCVDSASVAEVIYILVDNASKYAPAGTTITVRANRLDEAQVQVRVSDEGPGIPEELRERVFEKFFRIAGREPADSRRGGVGLGLPIARRLVEAQTGRIWIEPASASPGGGTTVSMVLPVARELPENGTNDRMAVVAAMK